MMGMPSGQPCLAAPPPVWWERHETIERDSDIRERMVASALCGFARLVTNVRAVDIGRLFEGPQEHPRVYVANHTSHADFLLLWASLPRVARQRTRPVAAADYWNSGSARQYLAERVFGAVLVERENIARRRNPLQPMLDAVRGGDSLILFPEGTRGNGAGVRPFRCGIYHLLRELPQAEVIPVWIENLHQVFPRGALLPVPLECTVVFGQAFARHADEPKIEFLDRLRATVSGLRATCR